MFACLVSSPFTYDSFNRLYIAATWHMYQKLVKTNPNTDCWIYHDTPSSSLFLILVSGIDFA